MIGIICIYIYEAGTVCGAWHSVGVQITDSETKFG